ncbi:MAG: type II toxin-antitoxin system prevent-host-death family antitoxin [Clostridia bacterium]|nr:type II toxin-antitoxin system prevent-host-death family antitoxin [Clostridia bacterium]
MITVTDTDFQKNFEKYLQAVQKGKEIIILKNGIEIARLISKENTVSLLTDSLVVTLKNDYDESEIKAERAAKYESMD